MSLLNAALVLDDLNAGRIPDIEQAVRGLHALDPFLLQGGAEQALHDAAATLELLIATGGTVGLYVSARLRAGAMADAVRRVMPNV